MISTMLFLGMTSLCSSQSFVLSEYDIHHLKKLRDPFKTDVLEYRFREINFFNGMASPFFITLFVIYGQSFTLNPLDRTIIEILYVTGLQLVAGTVFVFFDLRAETNWFQTRRFIFVAAMVSLCLICPLATWYIVISDSLKDAGQCAAEWPCKPVLSTIYDIWVFMYALLSLYPAMSILLNFKERNEYAPRIWHRDRWSALLRGDYQRPAPEHLIEPLNVSTNTNSSHVSGSVSNEPEQYRLPTKHKHIGKKLKLDKSMTSLYFLSKVSYKDDPKFPNALREMNCFGNATMQEYYAGKYYLYSIILVTFTFYLIASIYAYLISSVLESYAAGVTNVIQMDLSLLIMCLAMHCYVAPTAKTGLNMMKFCSNHETRLAKRSFSIMYIYSFFKFFIALNVEILNSLYMLYQVDPVAIVFSYIKILAIIQLDAIIYSSLKADPFYEILQRPKKDLPDALLIDRTTSDKNSWAHESYQEKEDQEELQESPELVKFRAELVARISKRNYKLSDYLPMQGLDESNADASMSESELSLSRTDNMEEDKRDMRRLLAMSFKHRFTPRSVPFKTLPRRLTMKQRSCCGLRRVTYRFWKVLYSSVFFYYTPFLAFFVNAYF